MVGGERKRRVEKERKEEQLGKSGKKRTRQQERVNLRTAEQTFFFGLLFGLQSE